jgi:Raf kinase inhibitor-like YbhB/YbcL family protein
MYKNKYKKYEKKLNLLVGGYNKFLLLSSAFENKNFIPKKYSCLDKGGKNISPPLEWKNAPKNTKSFVIIMRDPTAKLVAGKEWIHWILYNIPANIYELNTNNNNYELGINSWGEKNYGGMCPPNKNPKEHEYIFEIYALDNNIKSKDYNFDEIMKEIKNKILDKAILVGKFTA